MKALARQLGGQWLGGLVIYGGRKLELIAQPDIWSMPFHRLFQALGT